MCNCLSEFKYTLVNVLARGSMADFLRSIVTGQSFTLEELRSVSLSCTQLGTGHRDGASTALSRPCAFFPPSFTSNEITPQRASFFGFRRLSGHPSEWTTHTKLQRRSAKISSHHRLTMKGTSIGYTVDCREIF